MTVEKITSPITPNELINKTNEIIDNLGGGAPSNMVTTDTQQTISAIKTWTGQQFINGGVEFGYKYTNRSRGAFNFGAGSSKQPNAVISPNGYIDLTGYGNATTDNIRLDYYTANTLTIRRQLERGTIDNGTINIWSGNTEAASSTKFKLNKNGVFVNNNKVLDASSVDGTTITYNSTTGKISSAGGGVDIDNTTITQNADDELQTVAVIDNNSGSAIKTWTGTKAQYDAIATKDSNTLYNITDDTDVTLALLELLFPVGAVYFGTMSTCPLQTLGVGTWQALPPDKVIQIAGTRGSVGDTLNESLPNITGRLDMNISYSGATGALRVIGGFSGIAEANRDMQGSYATTLDASRSSSTYQDNAPVQQDAYLLNGWRRIA